jgi:hypothetical protein
VEEKTKEERLKRGEERIGCIVWIYRETRKEGGEEGNKANLK